MSMLSPDAQRTLAEKLDFLQSPRAYGDDSDAIEVIETHFAWVFLSRTLACKLNKPIVFHNVDYSTVEKRRDNCRRALTLNRRLAPRTYIDVVPLTRADSGLALGGDGETLDWLIRMHRLPAASMLDRRLTTGAQPTRAEITAIAHKLTSFYRETRVAPWSPEQYVQTLRRSLLQCAEELSALPLEIEAAAADRLVAAQLGFVERHPDLLLERARQGRIVDGHGDLRPEHVLVADAPEIIDCLEFSAELRLLDTAEEMSFLALECDRLDRPDVAAGLLEAYRAEADDPIDDRLLNFYASRRALGRAVLSAWHLESPFYADRPAKWVERTNWYLTAGLTRVEHALA